MRAKHVILRSSRSNTRDPFLGALPLFRADALVDMAPAPQIEVDELEARDVGLVTRDADVVAVAPAMPMTLIEPKEVLANVGPAANGTEWGIKAVKADTSPFTGNGVVVAVLDTGVDPTHPAFAGVNLVQRNFTTDPDEDRHGHGTHCAATIFGRNVQGTRIGVATGVTKALIGKVLGSTPGSSDQIARAIQWAVENGANVVSMSLGIDFPGFVTRLQAAGFPPALATSLALQGYRANVQLFERLAALIRAQGAFGQPTILVAAAGNESQRDQDSRFEIAVSPPAVAEGIISVAALGQGQNGLVTAPFSNTGANVSGPGVQVISANLGGGLVAMSGTSMATPHVAGVAALWAEKISQTRPLNAFEWTSRLISSSTTVDLQANFDPADVGAGLVQSPQA